MRPNPGPFAQDQKELPATEIWALAPGISFLNHGSFGSCPRAVLQYQQDLRSRLESQPVQFLVRELEARMDDARAKLAQFLNARPEDLVFVPNATHGINTVLRSLRFHPGDELLITSHAYNASRNALEFAAQQHQATVVTAAVPFPLTSPREVLDAIRAAVTPRTRLALIDHVTSPTGLIFPLPEIVSELNARGIDTLVDGAHAPGMIPVNLQSLNAAFYTGNCHKWICAPKGAAFLHVRNDLQSLVRPLSISHGANSPRRDRSRFLLEFGWTGTQDPTAPLTVPFALDYVGSLHAGGWTGLMNRNQSLALSAREILCRSLGIAPSAPGSMIGALAAVPLPDTSEGAPPLSPLYSDPLQQRLWEEYQIEVPIAPWPSLPKRLLRVSAQLYNSEEQYHRLSNALKSLV